MGRTNKLVDGCYSFWQGGAFPLAAISTDALLRAMPPPRGRTGTETGMRMETGMEAETETETGRRGRMVTDFRVCPAFPRARCFPRLRRRVRLRRGIRRRLRSPRARSRDGSCCAASSPTAVCRISRARTRPLPHVLLPQRVIRRAALGPGRTRGPEREPPPTHRPDRERRRAESREVDGDGRRGPEPVAAMTRRASPREPCRARICRRTGCTVGSAKHFPPATGDARFCRRRAVVPTIPSRL